MPPLLLLLDKIKKLWYNIYIIKKGKGKYEN